ncbi:LCP family protein [Erysipelothrix urinaevulpis]|uniref:LCP family protein n=1 Tax=Erysipelothrix urinaevulpis TaxID=2683717 RepID=UPI00135CDFDE|nr:LCP family protein [Erysipelothrix urinaevulpis]
MKKNHTYSISLFALFIGFVALILSLFTIEYIPFRFKLIILSILTMVAMAILIITKHSFWRFLTGLSLIIVSFYFVGSQYELNKLSQAHTFELVDYDLLAVAELDDEIKNIGFYGVRASHHEELLASFSPNIKFMNYESVDDLAVDLKENKIQAFLLNSNLVPEAIANPNLDGLELRQVNRYSVKVGSSVQPQKIDVLDDPFLVYLSGIDVFGDVVTRSRSDMNLVLAVNPKKHEVLVVTIPRDTYLNLGCENNSLDKLTHAGLYGVGCSMKTLENYFGLEFNYYARINFTGLVNLVDAVGGVNVFSPNEFTTDKGTVFIQGENHINGQEALEFARARTQLDRGDIDRGLNHQYLLEAIMNKMLSENNVYSLPSHLPLLRNVLDTNLSDQDISKIISNQISNQNEWNVRDLDLKGVGAMKHTYSQDKRYKYYVYIPDKKSRDEIMTSIEEVMNVDGQ